MRIVDKFMRVGLVVMILLSLFLSWKIWTNSGSKEPVNNMKTSENTLNLKQAKDVFSPVKLIYHNEEGQHLYTNKENLISTINKEIMSLKGGNLTVYSEKDSEKFLDSQTKKNSFELVMASPINLVYYLTINNQEITRGVKESMMFQRVVVSLDEKALYLLNDQNREVYHLTLSGDLSKTNQLLKDEGNRYLEVLHVATELPFFYQFKDQVTLKKYSYILATQSYTLFTQAFFDNTQEIMPSDTSKESKDINLINAEGASLKVQYTTGEVEFSGRIKTNSDTLAGSSNIYNDTLYYVQSIGNSMGTIRYFEGTDNKVIYRNFVEGFPIFSENTRGRVEVTKSNQIIQVRTNQETIQVPIPSDEEVELPNTETVLAELQQMGIEQKAIEDLQIGYTWETNQETKQVVDLVPEWYVKVAGNWESIAIMKDTQAEGGGE